MAREWRLRLLSNDVAVMLVPHGDYRLGGYAGTMHQNQQWIALDAEQGPDQIVSTLLHEIIEWVQVANGLKLEEQVIRSLEAGLYSALKDNGVDLTPLMMEETAS